MLRTIKKISFEQKNEKNKSPISPIFIVATSDIIDYTNSMTGDIDYAYTLYNSIRKESNHKITLILQADSSEEIFNRIYKEIDYTYSSPILHLILNPNAHRTGSMLKPMDLDRFKKSGGKVMVTAIEFAKYDDGRINASNVQKNALAYFKVADEIVFLDEYDKTSALKKANVSLQTKIENAHVIPVPPTISISHKHLAEHGKDIISFGMIRKRKGMEHILKLAELLKHEPYLKDKLIHIVGSVSFAKTDEDDTTFQQILEALYPNYIPQIRGKSHQELIELYKIELKNITTSLPIQLEVNVEEKELPKIFSQCTYSFLPAYRGATLRNSSISSSLANNFITYTHTSRVTPDCFRKGGKYNNALVLIPNYNYDSYAESVLKDIILREKNPTLNITTASEAKKLANEQLSPYAIASLHSKIHIKLSKVPEDGRIFKKCHSHMNSKASMSKHLLFSESIRENNKKSYQQKVHPKKSLPLFWNPVGRNVRNPIIQPKPNRLKKTPGR